MQRSIQALIVIPSRAAAWRTARPKAGGVRKVIGTRGPGSFFGIGFPVSRSQDYTREDPAMQPLAGAILLVLGLLAVLAIAGSMAG